jgi:AcrR family transcriptional regulator
MPRRPPSRSGEPILNRRRRGTETADRILDAAEALFAERGLAGASLREVAEAVGLRIPSLYNHFPSKAALYAAVLERGMAPILSLLSEYIEAGESAYRDPRQVIERMMKLLSQRPDLPRLIQHELLTGGEPLALALERGLKPTFDRGLAMLQASPASQHWKPEQLPHLLLAFFHVAVGYFTSLPLYRGLYGASPLSEPAIAVQTEFFSGLVGTLIRNGPARAA